MNPGFKSFTLPLLMIYLLSVTVSQMLLIWGIAGGLHLPETLAISTDAGNIALNLLLSHPYLLFGNSCRNGPTRPARSLPNTERSLYVVHHFAQG